MMLLEVEWPPLVNEIKAKLLENEEVLNLLDIISIMVETSHHTIPMSEGQYWSWPSLKRWVARLEGGG